jgi:hypothetical protein
MRAIPRPPRPVEHHALARLADGLLEVEEVRRDEHRLQHRAGGGRRAVAAADLRGEERVVVGDLVVRRRAAEDANTFVAQPRVDALAIVGAREPLRARLGAALRDELRRVEVLRRGAGRQELVGRRAEVVDPRIGGERLDRRRLDREEIGDRVAILVGAQAAQRRHAEGRVRAHARGLVTVVGGVVVRRRRRWIVAALAVRRPLGASVRALVAGHGGCQRQGERDRESLSHRPLGCRSTAIGSHVIHGREPTRAPESGA